MGQTVSSAKSSASKLWCFINPRFASSESFTPFYGNYEKFKSREDCFNLQIHPHELQFPFELKKEISCSLQLSNKSDNYLAFKVDTTNPKKYYVMPNIGAVLPRSTCDIIVTMQAQKEAPLNMQCKDEFVIQSIVANHKRYHSKNGATTKDITPEMFNKESGYEVEECKLRVVYVAPPQPPSPVREGSDKDWKASSEQVEQQNTSFQIHPQDLQFPFELRKQISCSLQLSNNSDNNVAFKVLTTNPKKYCVRPNNGVVLPWSTCDIIVTMQAQKEAPLGMQCKDKFLIQSIVANHKSYHSKNGSTTKDITTKMFKNESGYKVDECKLRVVYVAPPQPPSPVQEGSDEKSSPRASGFSDKFNKESAYEVEECKLRVVYVAPSQPPSLVREGYDRDSKASNEQVEQQDTSLQIYPQELQFPFELRKQISCSLQFSNKSDNYVAFKVKTTNPKNYCVRPNIGVVLPRSTCDITVKMKGQKEAPPNMQCIDKFLIQSLVANPGATTKDITPKMFEKESGYETQECKFKVVYVPPPQPPSPVREGSDEDLSPRTSGFSDKARALISKLTEERNSAIEKNKRLEHELELLRREANNDSHTS